MPSDAFLYHIYLFDFYATLSGAQRQITTTIAFPPLLSQQPFEVGEAERE